MRVEVDIDCRGLACPRPVIKTRERLSAGIGPFTVLVDNEAARENVERFAGSRGCEVVSSKTEGGYLVSVNPAEASGEAGSGAGTATGGREKVIFIGSDVVGGGDRKLGEALVKSFLYACTENEDRPARMVFMNSGVRLVTENDETASHVKKLEDGGVEIIVCGTCLDFYDLKDHLQVGRVSNMYEIQSVLIGADRLVSV